MDTIGTEVQQYEKRNFIVFAVNQIFMRLGWIFKTESVVMPGFLDVHTPSGIIRGFLPLISRIGQSVPQIFIAYHVAKIPRKQIVFVVSAFSIMIPWLVLALTLGLGCWSNSAIVAIFLMLYALHWLTYGSNILAHGTLQGKLIRPERRGRLLAYANIIGCALAIAAVWLVMPRWLRGENANYTWIFGTTGIFFGLAAYASLYFREPSDSQSKQIVPFLKYLGSGVMLLRYDRNFRVLAIVLVLFYMGWPIFPHYTIFGKRALRLVSRNFITLLIAQNTVSGLGSLVMGNTADRCGNRIVLRVLIFIFACVPLLAVGLSRLPMGARFYWLVYACLGFTPVSNRIFTNYTLEISPQEKHPQYLGMLSVLQTVPLFGSPVVGLLIDRFSFEPVFIACSALVFCGVLLTFWLVEPRSGQPV
jgi:MFS family permease